MRKADVKPLPGGPGQGVLLLWTDLEEGEAGDELGYPQFRHKTVQIMGNPVEFCLEGNNLPDGDEGWTPLHDEDGDELGRPGIFVMKENPLRLRPHLSRGSVIVVIVASH